MSHLHIPDGVLPIWLIVAGWLLAGVALAAASLSQRGKDRARRLPLLGVMAAVMLVGMSTEIVPIAYHVNLSVLAGIVLGPSLGFLAALIVNFILALFGHGGITVVGLNSLAIGTEAVAGYYLFRLFWRALKRRQKSPTLAAGIAVVVTLAISTAIMIGIVGVSAASSGGQPSVATEDLSFRNPFEHGFVASEFGATEHEHGQAAGAQEAAGAMGLRSFALLVVALGFFGWLLEAALTGAIVGYIYRVRPDLIVGRPRSLPGTRG